MTIDGMRYGSIDANLERRTGRNCWIEMSLTEGKNREVRNVLAYLGLQVSRLIRTSYGPFTVEGMEPGDVGEVPREHLFQLPPDAQVRIIAGEWRGRKLVAPEGRSTRPTADRTRETLFSMLASRLGSFDGLRVADLYAGSGALGARSAVARRGARRPSSKTTGRRSRRSRPMSPALGASDAIAAARHVGRTPAAQAEPFDLIFADPPYASRVRQRRRGGRRQCRLARARRLDGDRDAARRPGHAPDGWQIDAERDVGRARLTLLRA